MIRVADARAVTVTARLQSGAVLPSVFPAPLDGMLASVVHRRRMGNRYGSAVDHHRMDLPLCRTPTFVAGKQWVWAATCAEPDPGAGMDVHWWHQRFDDSAAEEVVDRLPQSTSTVRYKSWRVPLPVTVTGTLTWRALGDPDQLAELLADCHHVGKKRSQGEGLILEWSVADDGPADWSVIQGTGDGAPTRPWPLRAWEWLGYPSEPDTILAAIRPPYWRPPPTAEGPFGREWRPVIAPWARRQA